MAKILVIEDDDELCQGISSSLAAEHYIVEAVKDGSDGFERMRSYQYDLVIADWGLPGMTGVDLCKRYRSAGGQGLVLMLTGRATLADKEAGFEAGVDDYITKPFTMRELLARVRSLLRRAGQLPQSQTLALRDIVLDPELLRVTKGGADVKMTRKELLLLEAFLRNPERVFSSEALLKAAWGEDTDATDSTLRTHLKTLRKKLDDEGKPSIIQSVHGVGYKLNT